MVIAGSSQRHTIVRPVHEVLRPMQGFNNEHPNAKRAAVMKKKEWVRDDADRSPRSRCYHAPVPHPCMRTSILAS